MTGSEMQEVVRIVTDSVMAAVERRISSLGVSVRPATVTQESPLMVRLDGAKTPAPARVSGELSVGSRVLVLSSGTTLSVIGGSDGGDVEVSDLAGDFVLPVSKGGTGATSAAGAMSNLAYLGSNITGGTGGDTAAFWRGKGNGFALITSTGQLNGQPSQYGFLVNVVASSEVHQEWWTQSNGAHYRRGGNGSTGAMPGWTRIWDLSSALPVANGGTGATSAAAARSNLGAGTPYSLPAATASTRGGVRVGSGLKVSGDVLSVDNGAYVNNVSGWNVLRVGKLVICSRTWRSSSNMTCNIAWGSWLYSNLVQLPAYPVTFAAAPASHVEYVAGDDGANGDGIVLRQGPGKTASRPGSVYLVRPSGASYTFGHPTFAITAIGTVA